MKQTSNTTRATLLWWVIDTEMVVMVHREALLTGLLPADVADAALGLQNGLVLLFGDAVGAFYMR